MSSTTRDRPQPARPDLPLQLTTALRLPTHFRLTRMEITRARLPPAAYFLVYRMPDTPPSLWIDALNNIAITAGKDLEQNDDMSRPEFIAELPDEQKKELEELKKQNASAQSQEQLVKTINS